MTDIGTITVPGRLRGYPGVAFGGYVAGVLAGRAPAKTVRVDFRRPTPVEVPVELTGTEDGGAVLTGADGLLAVATPDEVRLDVPEPPSWDEAYGAAEAYRAAPPAGAVDCFGCGLDRTPDTGLRQHCGVVPGRDLVATAWTAGPALADAEGELRPELVWGGARLPRERCGPTARQHAGGGGDGVTHRATAPAGAGVRAADLVRVGRLGGGAQASDGRRPDHGGGRSLRPRLGAVGGPPVALPARTAATKASPACAGSSRVGNDPPSAATGPGLKSSVSATGISLTGAATSRSRRGPPWPETDRTSAGDPSPFSIGPW